MLGTCPGVAASILIGMGVRPIDLGRGRGRGLRWLKSAVEGAIMSMHSSAQLQVKSARNGRSARLPQISLADCGRNQLAELLASSTRVQ